MSRRDDLHVVPDLKQVGWKLVRAGRNLSHHRTQKWVETLGRRLARKNKVDLITHGRNGCIRSKDSFGNESPRKDGEH